ncbi:MAG TPA: gamma carbonic anhydrase family protein [Candidatus Deferrimicrobium sp.]|nr:gamma carbonic anhydrase family protein [Candidatus Deferrimicrobium sp.]
MPIYAVAKKEKVKQPEIDPSCWISEHAIIIGDVTIGPETVIYQGAIIRGDFAKVTIGAKNVIQDAVLINTADGFKTRIGDNNLLGFGCLVHGATIGNNSVIGIKATVMTGVKVGNDTLVGATAFVKMNSVVPDGQKWIGEELKGENKAGQMWEIGRQSWRKNGMWLKEQEKKC